MIRFKSFTLPGCTVLIRASSVNVLVEQPENTGTLIYVDGNVHHVAHTLEQVMSAMTKVRPIETDDSLFGRVFGSSR